MKQGDAIENLKALQKGLRDEQEKTKEEAIHKILSGTEGTSTVDNSKIEEQAKIFEENETKRQEAINETGKQELNNILTSKSNWDNYIKDKTSSDIGFNNTVRTNSANTTNELSGNYQDYKILKNNN